MIANYTGKTVRVVDSIHTQHVLLELPAIPDPSRGAQFLCTEIREASCGDGQINLELPRGEDTEYIPIIPVAYEFIHPPTTTGPVLVHAEVAREMIRSGWKNDVYTPDMDSVVSETPNILTISRLRVYQRLFEPSFDSDKDLIPVYQPPEFLDAPAVLIFTTGNRSEMTQEACAALKRLWEGIVTRDLGPTAPAWARGYGKIYIVHGAPKVMTWLVEHYGEDPQSTYQTIVSPTVKGGGHTVVFFPMEMNAIPPDIQDLKCFQKAKPLRLAQVSDATST